jgi:3-hydroxyisobutyrate dehydrogenase-like beta-hydroxyacid dehydrogenase
MSGKQNIGLIGVGLMGHGIGKNILKNGYSLTILAHNNRKPIDSLVGLGAIEADSAKAVAEASDIVFLCVTGSPQVEAVVLGVNGLLEGIHKGMVIVDCSTAEPASTAIVAEKVHAAGGRFVDTPMVRTPKEAEEGKLALMTGGDKTTLEEVRPILECFADTLIYSGGVGAAHKLKLVNNFIGLGAAAVAAEGISAAAKGGVEMQALHDVVVAGGSNSVMFERLMTALLQNDDTVFKFSINNAQKDLRYYTTMTQEQPSSSFIAESVHQTYVLANNLGYGEEFVPKLVDMMAQINDIKDEV